MTHPARTRWPGAAAAGLVLALAGGARAAQDTAQAVGIELPELQDAGLRAVGLPQIVLLALLGAAVFYVLNWVFVDVRFVGTNQSLWSGIVLAGGVAGILTAVFVPRFFIGMPLGVLLFAGAAVTYARHRNSLVSPKLTVLSKA